MKPPLANAVDHRRDPRADAATLPGTASATAPDHGDV